ncbi:MAG: outer membrane protein assembly factor BamD [Saprospiraceae bacterium]|nr:outer membrane protein assembly factor BamD [Saprospiraceae bacterium]
MKNPIFRLLGILVVLALLLASCKSEFERIRASGDVQVIYEKANAYYEEKEYQKAQTLYELIISSFRGRPEAEEIYYKYAYTYYYLEQYLLAAYYFKNFSQTYTNSASREEADFMTAYSNYQLSPTFRLDQTYTNKAIDEFQLFVNTYPRSERVEECNKLIDQMRAKLERKVFETGKLYFDMRLYQSATHVFENLLKDYPETKNGEETRYMIVRSAYLLAQNSVVDKQLERYQEAKEQADKFLQRYQNSAYDKEVNSIQTDSSKK